MELWRIIKLAVGHCGCVFFVCALFALTGYGISVVFPNDAVRWWIAKIDLMLAIITPTVLAIIFLNSLLRIFWDALNSIWKGVRNGNPQMVLA